MHIVPRAPPLSTDEPPNDGHRYASARIAASEEPKIIARLMLRLSTLVQGLSDVIDDVLGFYDFAVVFTHQPPIGSDQHHIDQVADRTVGHDLPAELEARQRFIDVSGTSGQEIPSFLVRPLLTRVIEQLLWAVMLGIDADRNRSEEHTSELQ